jgi:hypothetical protein
MRTPSARPNLIAVTGLSAALGFALMFASLPAAAQQWTPKQRAACEPERCAFAISTSRTSSVSPPACPLTGAISARSAAPSTASTERRLGAAEEPDHRHRRVLRVRWERECCRAAEQRDELASSHDGHGLPPLPLCTGVTGVERSSPDKAAVSLPDVQPATEWPAGPWGKLHHQYIRI